MSDFYQNGVVTVLHRLGQPNVDNWSESWRVMGASIHRPGPPSLYAELGRRH